MRIVKQNGNDSWEVMRSKFEFLTSSLVPKCVARSTVCFLRGQHAISLNTISGNNKHTEATNDYYITFIKVWFNFIVTFSKVYGAHLSPNDFSVLYKINRCWELKTMTPQGLECASATCNWSMHLSIPNNDNDVQYSTSTNKVCTSHFPWRGGKGKRKKEEKWCNTTHKSHHTKYYVGLVTLPG